MITSSENISNSDSPSATPTVLLVDDDINLRILMPESGNEAWKIIQSENVNLVMKDVRMADGIGLLYRIREKYPTLPPVILIIGYTELCLDGAKDWSSEAVFHKPCDRKALPLPSKVAIASQGF